MVHRADWSMVFLKSRSAAEMLVQKSANGLTGLSALEPVVTDLREFLFCLFGLNNRIKVPLPWMLQRPLQGKHSGDYLVQLVSLRWLVEHALAMWRSAPSPEVHAYRWWLWSSAGRGPMGLHSWASLRPNLWCLRYRTKVEHWCIPLCLTDLWSTRTDANSVWCSRQNRHWVRHSNRPSFPILQTSKVLGLHNRLRFVSIRWVVYLSAQ